MKVIDINPLFNELTSKEAAAISGGLSSFSTTGIVAACIIAPCPIAELDFEEHLKQYLSVKG